jgi:hypothetical protein
MKHSNHPKRCSLLLRLDTAENPAEINRLLTNNTILRSEILGDRHSTILILVHLTSNLVHLGRFDTLDGRIDISELQLSELVVFLVGENTERDVQRKSAVLGFVDGQDGDADVRVLCRDSGHGCSEGGKASEER